MGKEATESVVKTTKGPTVSIHFFFDFRSFLWSMSTKLCIRSWCCYNYTRSKPLIDININAKWISYQFHTSCFRKMKRWETLFEREKKKHFFNVLIFRMHIHSQRIKKSANKFHLYILHKNCSLFIYWHRAMPFGQNNSRLSVGIARNIAVWMWSGASGRLDVICVTHFSFFVVFS